VSDYDDDRPNWRELDRNRDKSKFYGRQENKEKKEGARLAERDRWQSGRVHDALDRLFMGKKGTVDHDKLFKKVHQSYGSDSFLRNVTRYIEKYGMPDDTATLLLMLDCKDQSIILNVIDKLSASYAGLTQGQKDDVLRKLSIVAMSEKSRDVRVRAEDAMGDLER